MTSTPNTLSISPRLLVALASVRRSSRCAPDTLVSMSSTSASMRCICSPCCATMLASCPKICPNSAIVDSMLSIAVDRLCRYESCATTSQPLLVTRPTHRRRPHAVLDELHLLVATVAVALSSRLQAPVSHIQSQEIGSVCVGRWLMMPSIGAVLALAVEQRTRVQR
jgi:hypothetical protein